MYKQQAQLYTELKVLAGLIFKNLELTLENLRINP